MSTRSFGAVGFFALTLPGCFPLTQTIWDDWSESRISHTWIISVRREGEVLEVLLKREGAAPDTHTVVLRKQWDDSPAPPWLRCGDHLVRFTHAPLGT